MKIGSLCSGYGGLEQGIQSVIPAELAWVAEWVRVPLQIGFMMQTVPNIPVSPPTQTSPMKVDLVESPTDRVIQFKVLTGPAERVIAMDPTSAELLANQILAAVRVARSGK